MCVLSQPVGNAGGNSYLCLVHNSKSNKLIEAGNLDIKGKDQIKRVYDPSGVTPTLSTMQGGNQEPKVILYEPK